MSLKHKTTVAFTISIYQEIESTKKSLNDLKNYIQDRDSNWNFEFQMDNKIVKGSAISLLFDELIEFLDKNTEIKHSDDSGEDYVDFLNYDKFIIQAGGPDDSFGSYQEGNVKFNNSIVIISDDIPVDEWSEVNILINANIPNYFANELNPENQGLCITAEAVDVNGYHFEFTI